MKKAVGEDVEVHFASQGKMHEAEAETREELTAVTTVVTIEAAS